MIEATIGERRLRVRGHAGYDESGRDIVCAAVSALVYALVGALEEGGWLESSVLQAGLAVVEGKDGCGREFAMTGQGLRLLARQYPEYISVKELPSVEDEDGSWPTTGRSF